MSSMSDTARLSSNPEHDIMLQDPHPDLVDQPTKPARMTGGGMREAMTAKYDPSTKLATGTTMAEYKRINMRATTIGMWGGLAAGGLISESSIGTIFQELIIAMALKRRTNLSRNALTFSFLCMSSRSRSGNRLICSYGFIPFLRYITIPSPNPPSGGSSKSKRCQTPQSTRWRRIHALRSSSYRFKLRLYPTKDQG
jgi:hypothetical protein